MGKRKSRTSKLLAKPRKQPKLETSFKCPFCNHPDSVECFIDAKEKYAVAMCFACKDYYRTKAHALTEPIDVYSVWIDACEDAKNKNKPRVEDGDDA